jgi:transcriptional regulator with XRE-family HTH domain
MNKNYKLDDSKITERLRLAREMAGLTQAQVAQMLNLHRPSISEIEAGRRKVSAKELTQFSEIYGVSIAWLTDSENEIDTNQVRIELAARELSQLKPEDLDRVLRLLSALRQR